MFTGPPLCLAPQLVTSDVSRSVGHQTDLTLGRKRASWHRRQWSLREETEEEEKEVGEEDEEQLDEEEV